MRITDESDPENAALMKAAIKTITKELEKPRNIRAVVAGLLYRTPDGKEHVIFSMNGHLESTSLVVQELFDEYAARVQQVKMSSKG